MKAAPSTLVRARKAQGSNEFERRKMTDQTRWGIPEVQMKNKAKAFEDQKEMREEIKNFVFNCSVYSLHKMYEEMKRLEKNS